MADENEYQSHMASAGRQTPIAESMNPQVKYDVTTSPANYGAAYAQSALTPDILGQLGATMALNASQELSKRRGIQAGMNPSGDVLPAITASDKAFVDAYQNQSQATLTNQAQMLFDKSQEAMSKSGRLSPGSIADYQKNLGEGLQDILKLAPTDVRASLFNQFRQQAESSSHHYRMQLQAQQKQAALSSSNSALSQINQQIHGAAMDGNAEGATQFYQDTLSMINRGVKGGIYTSQQADTLGHTARLTLLSSLEIKKGLDAKRAGNMDTYLSDLADETKKPNDVSWSDWESIRANSAKYLNGVRSLESQHQQLTASDGYVEIAQGTMTAEKMEQLRGDLKESPLLFNNLAISFAAQQRKNNSAQASSNFYAQHWQNIDALRDATPKDLNRAFDSLTQLKMQQANESGNPITAEEAQYQIAAASAVPIPAYNKKLGDYLTSGNPELMMQGLQDFERLNQYSGNKTAPLLSNKKAMAMMSTFDGFLKQGKDAQTAADMAQEIVYQKTPDQVSTNNAQISINLNKHASTPSRLNSWANNIANIPSDAHVANQAALTSAIVGMYKENMQWTNANEDVSIDMISKSFDKAWGISTINGRTEMTYLPPEKIMGLDKGAIPLMQLEIANQIKLQVADTKAAYDQGKSNFYYEVKERPSFEAYITAKNAIREKGLRDPEYATHKEFISAFDKGEPVEIERIYRNKTKESFKANVVSNPYQGIDPNSGQLKGDYDIALIRKDTGTNEPFIGIYGGTHITPVYRPDVGMIKSRYLAVNGINPQDYSPEAILKKIDELKSREAMGGSAGILSRALATGAMAR